MRGVLIALWSLTPVAAVGLTVASAPSCAVAADPIDAKVGDAFTVRLPVNAGVKWSAALGDAAGRVQELAPGPVPGGMAEAKQAYNFKALKAGKTTFVMQKREVGSGRLVSEVTVVVNVR